MLEILGLDESRFLDVRSPTTLIYKEVKRVNDEQKTINPFKEIKGFREEFLKVVNKYKIKDRRIVNLFIWRFKVCIDRTFDMDNMKSFVYKKYSLVLPKAFFELDDTEQLDSIRHELTHCIQFLIIDPGDKEYKKYEHSPYEVAAISKDIFFETARLIRAGKICSRNELAEYIRLHPHYVNFKRKDRKKTFQKIVTNIMGHYDL